MATRKSNPLGSRSVPLQQYARVPGLMGRRSKEEKKYGRRYDWGNILIPGRVTTLRREKDFNGRPDTMVVQVRRAAVKLGVRVSVSVSSDSKTVTVTCKGHITRARHDDHSEAEEP